MDSIIQIFTNDIKVYGYLSLALSLNLIVAYFIFYYSERAQQIYHKKYPGYPLTYLLVLSWLFSSIGSLVYLFVLYPWYSTIIFIVFSSIVAIVVYELLERKEGKVWWKRRNEKLARYEGKSEQEIRDIVDINRESDKQKKAKEELESYTSDLSQTIFFGVFSVVLNLYAAYQILFNYYQI